MYALGVLGNATVPLCCSHPVHVPGVLRMLEMCILKFCFGWGVTHSDIGACLVFQDNFWEHVLLLGTVEIVHMCAHTAVCTTDNI